MYPSQQEQVYAELTKEVQIFNISEEEITKHFKFKGDTINNHVNKIKQRRRQDLIKRF